MNTKPNKKLFNFLKICMLSLLFFSCENLKKKPETAQNLFEKAESQSKKGYFIEALDTVLKLKYKFPYSSYSISADMLKADVLFDQREWEQAQKAYQAFIDLYPQHERVQYAYYRQILSWDKQIPKTADRDTSLTESALELLDLFLKKYPKNKFKKEVEGIRKTLFEKQIEKEWRIANFYFKQKKYKSALKRLEFLIKKYPESPWNKSTLMLIVETARKLNDEELEKKYLKQLESLK